MMEARYPHEERDTLAPTCSFALFDCLSPRHHTEKQVWSPARSGVERDMAVMYQQPHLVPPMKLTVFGDLPPPTPPPSGLHFPAWMSPTRSRASGFSDRPSSFARRKVFSKASISAPKPIVMREPSVRRRDFRPLELSIYLPNNRLSDLPEFDSASFTEVGEIKFPPKALLRAKSEEFLPLREAVKPVNTKPASMFERRASYMRPTTRGSVVSTSRPPSEHDALHSHPVSWASLPGLPPQINMASEPKHSLTILSPMQEEFTPPASSNVINDIVMDFPAIETKQEMARQSLIEIEQTAASPPRIPITLPVRPIPVASPPMNAAKPPPAPYFHTNYQTQQRISQWLANRSHSSSISTVKTTASSSTTSSFAEHRRKRSQFYMLSAGYVPPPKPLLLVNQHQHQRSMTASTIASSIASDILSVEDDMESMTTAPTASEIQSRTGTIKSVNNATAFLHSTGLRPIQSGIPVLPDSYMDVVDGIGNLKQQEVVVIKEINGPLRSPMGVDGVGVAI